MKITNDQSDEVVSRELGARIKRIRLERNLDQRQFASEAGIGRGTLQRLENGSSTNLTTLLRVLRTLGMLDAADRLVPEPVPSPIEQLERGGRQRRRARPKEPGEEGRGRPWTWAEEGGSADESSR